MKTHNVITDNCEKIRPEYQPATVRFDYMKASKAEVTAKHNFRIKSSARNDNRPPWQKLKDDDALTHNCMQQWRRENGILNDVTLTSSLLSLVQVVMAPFVFFSVALNVKMDCDRNYKNLLNFVKVMPKILVVPFFPDTVYTLQNECQLIQSPYICLP